MQILYFNGTDDEWKNAGLSFLVQSSVVAPSPGVRTGTSTRAKANGLDSLPAVGPMTTSTIMSRLGFTRREELVLAAVAKLTLVDGKKTVTREEIRSEAQSAGGYYDANVSKSLLYYLKKLAGTSITEVSNGVYTLSHTKEVELVAKLESESHGSEPGKRGTAQT